MTVTVAAIDVAFLVDLQPHAGVAEGGWGVIPRGADVSGPVAGNAVGIGEDGFGLRAHGSADYQAFTGISSGQMVPAHCWARRDHFRQASGGYGERTGFGQGIGNGLFADFRTDGDAFGKHEDRIADAHEAEHGA